MRLTLETVDGADAEPYFPCHLADADALGQLSPCQFDLVGFGARTAELRAHDAPLTLEFAIAGNLVP